MKANSKQVGGAHYASKFQHWDYVAYVGLPYIMAQLTRYVTRWKKKNGIEDVQKAIHYVEKERELLMKRKEEYRDATHDFCVFNELGEHEKLVLDLVVDYHAGQLAKLQSIDVVLRQMLAILEGKSIAPQANVLLDPTFREDRDEWKTK